VTSRPDLIAAASNLDRFPFESATMAEAGRLAANVLRNIAAATSGEPAEVPETIWLQFSDDGQNIRKWSIVPFEGGRAFSSGERS
jgi:hypothetical protein